MQTRVPEEATKPVGTKGGPPPAEEDVAGVACSGGGIRSAAFTLGALQALDEADVTSDDPGGAQAVPGTGGNTRKTELSLCRWLCSVSGGSYMAAAWVTARASYKGTDAPLPWVRRSPEEDYLRRHSSYMAPGFAGKLWALVWFLLGLLLNVGLIVLTPASSCCRMAG